MLAVGDALALVLSRLKDFTPEQFAVFHPGGSLGRKLSRVGDVMRRMDELRVARDSETIRQVLVTLSRPGRRTGAVMLVDAGGCLSGIFTDSDLARLLEQRRDEQLDRSIAQVMTRDPLTVGPDTLLTDAVSVLSENKVSELPVVDSQRRPLGLLDITDLIGLLPSEAA